jgi:hypothetical protein
MIMQNNNEPVIARSESPSDAAISLAHGFCLSSRKIAA